MIKDYYDRQCEEKSTYPLHYRKKKMIKNNLVKINCKRYTQTVILSPIIDTVYYNTNFNAIFANYIIYNPLRFTEYTILIDNN